MENNIIIPGWIKLTDFVEKYHPELDENKKVNKHDSYRKKVLRAPEHIKAKVGNARFVLEKEFCLWCHIDFKEGGADLKDKDESILFEIGRLDADYNAMSIYEEFAMKVSKELDEYMIECAKTNFKYVVVYKEIVDFSSNVFSIKSHYELHNELKPLEGYTIENYHDLDLFRSKIKELGLDYKTLTYEQLKERMRERNDQAGSNGK